jgi:hypothetical protein
MTRTDRRLVALAAAFAPERAGRLLSRLGTLDAEEACSGAAALATAGRTERLAALATALAEPARGGAPGVPAERAAVGERPRVAAVLRGLAAGGEVAGAAPTLVRLCRKTLDRS